ncbi:MAG: prepilin peptidase [Candidatus Omnitrophica bacterium]|nr:prepilin peptidase [Candidatus Omnitrophota bacterium]
MITKILVFIFGSVVGSFLNVCIYRMPEGKSIVWPRSHCPHCQKKIFWYDNIPFISYILLKGRCRFCKGKISLRYLIVEFLTALMFLIFFNRYGLSFEFLFYTFFGCSLIIATFVDIKHRIIPDEISIGGLIIGFLLNTIRAFSLKPLGFNFSLVLDSFLGIIIGAGMIYLTGLLFDLVYFKLLKMPPIDGETESMGFGDVKFLAMIGAFLGWQKVLLTFFIAPFFGALVGIFNLLIRKDHTIPYGPFLSLGAVISLFWADKIISLILIR